MLKIYLPLNQAAQVSDEIDDTTIQDSLRHVLLNHSLVAGESEVSGTDVLPIPGSDQRQRTSSFRRVLKFMEGISTIAKQPSRLKWAMIDREKCQDGLKRLRELTDYLLKFVGDTQMRDLLRSTHDAQLAILLLTEDVDDLKSLMISNDTESMGSGSELSSTVSTRTAFSFVSESRSRLLLRELISFKLRMRREARGKDILAPLPDTFKFELQAYKKGVDGARNIASIDGKPVWVEWKSYTPAEIVRSEPGSYLSVPKPATLQRVQRLASLLRQEKPKAFRVPQCFGYLDDSLNQRFGFVFERSLDEVNVPCSLRSILGKDKVSLNRRVEIAQQLADAMLYLHAVGWLHKGFRSSSVIFFARGRYEVPGELCPDLKQAYISGFEFSRPDELDLTTTAPSEAGDYACYVHPEYRYDTKNRRFHRSFDIYSLGIVLVELAYWRPIVEIMASVGLDPAQANATACAIESPTQSEAPTCIAESQTQVSIPCTSQQPEVNPTVYQSCILEENGEVSTHILMTMGQRYLSVVQACIRGLHMDGGNQFTENAHLQQAFINEVVEPLKGIAM